MQTSMHRILFCYVFWFDGTALQPAEASTRAVRCTRVPEEAPEAVWQLIKELWNEDPSARPSAGEVVTRLRRLQPGLTRSPSLPLSVALSE